MTATYQLKPYELTDDFLKMLKEAFHDREIIITIEAHDETAYLLHDEANRKFLLEAVEAVKQRKFARIMTLEELEALST
jgi:phospholipid N-methyltransferase